MIRSHGFPRGASQPYSLAMFPAGARDFLFIRPDAWFKEPSGQAMVEAFASPIDALWKPIAQHCQIPLEAIQEIGFGFYAGRSDGWPVQVCSIRTHDPVTQETITTWMPGAVEQKHKDQSIWVKGDVAAFLDPSSNRLSRGLISRWGRWH